MHNCFDVLNKMLNTDVMKFEGQGRKDEEVRGDEPQKGSSITQNKTITTKRKQNSGALLRWFSSSSSVGLSPSRMLTTAGRREPFQVSPAITGIRYRC